MNAPLTTMPAAAWPEPGRDRLLHVRADGELQALSLDALPTLLRPGDLLVLNDAATLPACLAGRVRGHLVELRLAAWGADGRVPAVLMGEGSWQDDTDLRPSPPTVEVGEVIVLAEGREARVEAVDPRSPRLVRLRLPLVGDALLAWLYRHAWPVQYRYAAGPLPLAMVQTGLAGRPWSVEMPSASRPLSWQRLLALRRFGVGLAVLTHGAGLSATGDPALDARLPLPEPYEIPAATVAAVQQARARGGRVIAAGTTVVRALEAAALRGLPPGPGTAELVIDAHHPRAVVDGLITNMHGPGESHFQLASAFVPVALLARAHQQATAWGFRAHELGDVALIGV